MRQKKERRGERQEYRQIEKYRMREKETRNMSSNKSAKEREMKKRQINNDRDNQRQINPIQPKRLDLNRENATITIYSQQQLNNHCLDDHGLYVVTTKNYLINFSVACLLA